MSGEGSAAGCLVVEAEAAAGIAAGAAKEPCAISFVVACAISCGAQCEELRGVAAPLSTPDYRSGEDGRRGDTRGEAGTGTGAAGGEELGVLRRRDEEA